MVLEVDGSQGFPKETLLLPQGLHELGFYGGFRKDPGGFLELEVISEVFRELAS